MKLERLLVLAVSIAFAACSDTIVRSETETHFLLGCVRTCGDGLSCICDVCTEPCTSDDACAALPGGASCIAIPSACGGEVESACDVECTSSDDCMAVGSGRECVQGRCRAAARPESGQGGQSGVGGSGGQSAGDDGGGVGVCLAAGALCEEHGDCCGFEATGSLCVDPDGPSDPEPSRCFSGCDGEIACPDGFRCNPTSGVHDICVATQ